MSTLMAPPRFTPVSGAGTTYPAAQLFFYITGTSTPKNTYSNADLDISHVNANPVVADANGLFGPIYLTSGDYKVILKDEDDNTIWTVDPLPGLNSGDTLTTRGDLLTRDANGFKRLAIGASGYVLTSDGVDPSWEPPAFPRGYIQGLTYSNNVADATNDIDIAVGGATDATNARTMILAAAITKRLDAAWAVGTNQGGLDTGSIADTDYYIWLIQRPDTDVVDVLFSTSATAPTMPANYTFKRLIGYFKRVSAAILAFKVNETSGGGIHLNWSAPTKDISLANTLNNTRRTDALKVPLNFATDAHVRVVMGDAGADFHALICSPDEADVAVDITGGAAPLYNIVSLTSVSGLAEMWLRTDATGKIAARVGEAMTVDSYAAVTLGFEWSRR